MLRSVSVRTSQNGLIAAAVAVCIGLIANPATRAYADAEASRGSWGVEAGLGFSADPAGISFQFAFPVWLHRRFSLAPVGQGNLANGHAFGALTLNGRYTLRVSEPEASGLARLGSFVDAGAGVAGVFDDGSRGGSTRSEGGLATNLGLGLDYRIVDGLSLVSVMRANYMPEELAGQNFIYTWYVLGLRYTVY